MNSTTKAPAKALAKIRSRSTRDLITDFILTDSITDPDIFTVRGWIMDELEFRNPEAFSRWLENYNADEDLLTAFGY